MEVVMPYGKVDINTPKEAVDFLRHACNDCYRNNLMNPCSGAMAKKCDEQKKQCR